MGENCLDCMHDEPDPAKEPPAECVNCIVITKTHFKAKAKPGKVIF